MKNKRIQIKDNRDLLDIMTDMLDEFLESMVGVKGLTREPEPEDYISFEGVELGFMYTQKAMHLIDRYKYRMQIIFENHFPDDVFELDPRNIIYP